VRIQNPQLKVLLKTPRRRTYTAVAITILLVGFLVFFSLRPTFVKIADLNKEIKDKEVFREKVDEKFRTINSLIAQKQSIAEELQYFEQSFPTDHRSGYVVANIAAMAESFNLDLMNVEFSEQKGEKYKLNYVDVEEIDLDIIKVVEVNTTVEGNLTDIEKYIERLEEFPRTLDVRTINLSSINLTEFRESLEEYRPIRASIVMMFYLWNPEGPDE